MVAVRGFWIPLGSCIYLQQVGVPSEGKGNLNPGGQGSPLYVGVAPYEPDSVDERKKKKDNKKEGNDKKRN